MFEKAWKVQIEKIEILVMKNISPLNFAKYLSYSEAQKNSNVVNNWKKISASWDFFLNLLQNYFMGSFC